jgi:uncharacterized cupin superfamily protein
VASSPLPDDQVVIGDPQTGATDLYEGDGWSVGVWTHSAGTSTDVEVDEVFVVLEGRADIAVEGGASFTIGPGDAVVLAHGDRTTWTIHEPLRKLYVTLPTAP